MTPAQLEALGRIAEAAVAAERETGCPAEVSAAQCIVESAWLQVAPGNNCFGIKATDDGCQYCLTKEYLNGEWTSQKLAFATYPTLATGFAAHAKMLQCGVYALAWQLLPGEPRSGRVHPGHRRALYDRSGLRHKDPPTCPRPPRLRRRRGSTPAGGGWEWHLNLQQVVAFTRLAISAFVGAGIAPRSVWRVRGDWPAGARDRTGPEVLRCDRTALGGVYGQPGAAGGGKSRL
jgi:hypothetical protein